MDRHIELSILRKITNDFSDSSKIGSGGYGVVYKGEYQGKTIAVKLLDPLKGIDDDIFMNELGNHKRVQHPNIVQLVGYCNDEHKRYYEPKDADRPVFGKCIYKVLCFEYMEGGSLEKRLSTTCAEDSLGNDWCTHYKIIKGICQGLCCLHRASILHLDLNPSNILLDKDLTAKIADFGLSRIFTGSHSHVILEMVAGTTKYMPPELKRLSEASEKTDIFSLGVTIIDIMAGPQGYNNFSDREVTEFTEEVLTYWTNKSMTAYLYEVKRCINIAIGCVHHERIKRPTVQDILRDLNNMETEVSSMTQEEAYTPAGEVPEAKKIAECASGEDKNKLGSSEKAEATSMQDISLSVGGQCTEQTEQWKFYPPQSFSCHYPTNGTYLREERHRAVDVTRGAMGSLLNKLGKLVTEEYSLDTVIKRDIKSFSDDLMIMHQAILKLESVDTARIWVDKVRDMSYNIEDMVDSFLVHVEPDSNSSGFRELMHEGLKLWENDIITHQIGDVIRDIKKKVQDIADKGKKYNIDVKNVVANATEKATIDPRMGISRKKDQLIGIEEPRDKIISIFEEYGDVSKKELRIVSIVGMGGLGKTTLAKAVCDKIQAQYDLKCFVLVGQNPNVGLVLEQILRKLAKDFNAKNLNMWELIEVIQELLEVKRYLIVVDDIWDSTAWGVIQSAFPGNERGSRVITTTRDHRVALACCNSDSDYVYEIKPLGEEDSKGLLFRGIFGSRKDCYVTPRKEYISKYILERCSGMPLAINSISSLLAGGKDSTWEYVLNSLGALTEGNDLTIMERILDLSYIHLPDHLKTCLLYVCMYPEDREIDKTELLRKWVAEGFVHVTRNGVLDAEDVAEQYFEVLINMCMIQPEQIDYNNEVLSCSVHDMILDLMRSKSTKENFIQVIDGSKDVSGQICRVSVHYNDNEDTSILARINRGSLEHVRSVLLYRSSLVPYFLGFKYVRVLDLVYAGQKTVQDLNGIRRLFLLRYLKISFAEVFELPYQIGELQQLETIHLNCCKLDHYPSDIVSLPCLLHLIYDAPLDGIVLPDGIGRLKSLRTLEGVSVHRSSAENINALSNLTNLRRLRIHTNLPKYPFTPILQSNEANSALHSSICKLSASLRYLSLGKNLSNTLDVSVWSSSIFPQASNIRELDLARCNFERCPGWISQLYNLYKFKVCVRKVGDGVSIAAQLPSLAYFKLCRSGIEEESVVVPGSGAFQALKHLIFRCPWTSLTFEAGAMPKLEKLRIEFPYCMARRFLPVGVELLQADTLSEIRLRMAIPLQYSDEFRKKQNEHRRRFRTMLKRACKPHHPTTDIVFYYQDDKADDDNEDEEYVDDEDDCCNEEDDTGVAKERRDLQRTKCKQDKVFWCSVQRTAFLFLLICFLFSGYKLT